MRCSSCGFENPDEMNFCGKCAAPFNLPCPQCGFENPIGFAFCGKCAAPLSSAVASGQQAGTPPARQTTKSNKRSRAKPQEPRAQRHPREPGGGAPEAERRQLTVQFIDLVGSTTLSQQLDPEDYHGRVVAYQTACHQVIARYEGHIAQYLGDGVLVYFGYPAAHDEDAVRAVHSGLEIVAAVGQLEGTPPLQVRIGIHTGPVVVSEIGEGGSARNGWR